MSASAPKPTFAAKNLTSIPFWRSISLIQTVVERIYIVDKDDERFCHIFIKGCSGEDYTSFFRATGYIATDIIPENGEMCDLDKDSINVILIY